MNKISTRHARFSVEEKISIGIILLFHLVGLILLNFTKGVLYFFALDLVPLNLIFTVLLMLKSQTEWNKDLIIYTLGAFLIGFFIEVAGVNSGLIFGKYTYGEVLGIKVFNTPILIGLNWFLITYSAGCLVERLKTGRFLKALFTTVLLVVFDYFLEPVAIKHDFWSWHNGNIPDQNYIGWFGSSLLICLLFQFTDWPKGNKVASMVFIIQFVFFLVQNIF